MTNETILVRLIDNKNERLISAYHTTNWSEALKLYAFAKTEQIELSIASEENAEYDDDCIFFVDEVCVQFGGKVGCNSISVYVEVL